MYVPPVVPSTPVDAIPAFGLLDVLRPMTAVAPTLIAVFVGVLVIAGILWTIDVSWRRFQLHVIERAIMAKDSADDDAYWDERDAQSARFDGGGA